MMENPLNPVRRKEVEAKLHAQAKPTQFFPHYLIYKYDFSWPYVIGFDNPEDITRLLEVIEPKSEFVAMTTEYPYELFDIWGKK